MAVFGGFFGRRTPLPDFLNLDFFWFFGLVFLVLIPGEKQPTSAKALSSQEEQAPSRRLSRAPNFEVPLEVRRTPKSLFLSRKNWDGLAD